MVLAKGGQAKPANEPGAYRSADANATVAPWRQRWRHSGKELAAKQCKLVAKRGGVAAKCGGMVALMPHWRQRQLWTSVLPAQIPSYAAIAEWLARQIAAFEDYVKKQKGVIDLVIADRGFATFGAIRPCVTHRLSAVECADSVVHGAATTMEQPPLAHTCTPAGTGEGRDGILSMGHRSVQNR
eukprot:gene15207-biopygen10519